MMKKIAPGKLKKFKYSTKSRKEIDKEISKKVWKELEFVPDKLEWMIQYGGRHYSLPF